MNLTKPRVPQRIVTRMNVLARDMALEIADCSLSNEGLVQVPDLCIQAAAQLTDFAMEVRAAVEELHSKNVRIMGDCTGDCGELRIEMGFDHLESDADYQKRYDKYLEDLVTYEAAVKQDRIERAVLSKRIKDIEKRGAKVELTPTLKKKLRHVVRDLSPEDARILRENLDF